MMKITQYSVLTAALLCAPAAGLAQKKGDAAKGKEVFEMNCSVCHSADTADRKMGPGFKGLFKKAKLDSNGKPVNDANVMGKIEEGGNGMPSYKDGLSADEKANVLAYLKTL